MNCQTFPPSTKCIWSVPQFSRCRAWQVCSVVLLLTGCMSAPKETVELSEIVGEQVVAIQKSHEGFVRRFYAGLREDVDDFMRDVWVPAFMAKLPENEDVRADLIEADELMKIDSDAILTKLAGVDEDTKTIIVQALEKAKAEGRADLVQVMIGVSAAAQKEIEIQRKEMMKPIVEQEAMVLDQLRVSYADVQRGHATIQGYLASVVELKMEQDLILQKMGVLKERNRILDDAANVSSKLSGILAKIPDKESGETAEGIRDEAFKLLGIAMDSEKKESE